jgi:hypothetical protein
MAENGRKGKWHVLPAKQHKLSQTTNGLPSDEKTKSQGDEDNDLVTVTGLPFAGSKATPNAR